MYSFIVNPNAGNGRGKETWRRVEKRLKRLGTAYEVMFTRQPGDARTFAAELTRRDREPGPIVAVGGDGTLNEVLDGLSFEASPELGYIPAGSGNDLARSLRLSANPEAALKRVLRAGRSRQLDYGVVSYGEAMTHRRFMVSAGIGLDAAVCQDVMNRKQKPGRRLKLRRLAYVRSGICQLVCCRPARGYLLLDGVQKVEFNHIYFISAHIHPYEGGGFRMAPGADPSDGKLTLCVVHQGKKRKLIPILLGALTGGHIRCRGVRAYVCREAEIHMERPMAVHVDGESCQMQKDLQIRCIPQQIRMIL